MSHSERRGKPPKNAAQIRAALQSVQRGVDAQPIVGDAAGGFGAYDSIIIGSFRNHRVGRGFQQELLDNGIWCSAARTRGQLQISVDGEHRERAGNLYRSYINDHPDHADAGRPRRFDLPIFGSLIGATIGLVLLYFGFRRLTDIVVVFSFGFAGALIGHVIQRIGRQFRRAHRPQFGVWDLLVLTVLPVIAFSIIELTRVFVLQVVEP